MPTIPANDLNRFATELLTAGGFSRDHAAQTADLLVWANLRGVDSHGVLRIPRYIEMVAQGIIVSDGAVRLVREHGAVAVLDGDKCPGAVGMGAAVSHAARLARLHGVGWCSARRISHAGAIGYFANALAEQGLIGIIMTASKPLMSYFGAKGEALSSNPLAIAVPLGAGQDPVVLDMSTAAVAMGKILAARDAGEAIPLGWAIDSDGHDTTDPRRAAALLPMAGAKGSGLALMIEMLTSVLAGNAIIAPVLLGQIKGGFNGLAIAVDPAAFGPDADFTIAAAELATAIHALPPAAGVAQVFLPGERGAQAARARSNAGIPLPVGTVRRLADIAATLSVPLPSALA